MKIGYLGTGSWGFCLANLLASKGYDVVSWTTNPALANQLNTQRIHPRFPGILAPPNMRFTTDLEETLNHADVVVESVTAAGIRPVFEQVRDAHVPTTPIIITSKGIEQDTTLTLPEVALEVLGASFNPLIGFISGPGFAQEIIHGLPTSVVGTAFDQALIPLVCETFTHKSFRVYPNADIIGVALGGALKNIIAIACGISDGLNFGQSARAALITRGLHEIRKLAVAKGCKAETIYGLAGMGDVCLTCNSTMSRNFQFGQLLAQGKTQEEAFAEIGMVVEGAYSCIAAMQLLEKLHVPMPITEMVYKVVHKDLKLQEAVQLLMQRTVKEEHL
jgi:glycerol-3-phosphate dehydrogenase (NAD(P)+)